MPTGQTAKSKAKGYAARLLCVVCRGSCEDAKKRYNATQRQTAVLCRACEELGYTVADTDNYTCSDCQSTGGRRKFEAVSMYNHHNNKSVRLLCIICDERIRTKTAELKKKMRASKIKCKCSFPNHAPKCPLSSDFHSVHRFPGEDVLTKDERDFLNKLPFAPEWWIKAWAGIRKSRRLKCSAWSAGKQ